jgi:hypothetical protein
MFWGAASSNPQNETSEEDSYRVASDVIQNVRADTVCDCNQDSKALAESIRSERVEAIPRCTVS